MNEAIHAALTATLTLALLAGELSVVLLLALKRFRVQEDPRVDAVEELLPGVNCGACGCAGCRAFAELLVDKPNTPPCPVGGPEGARKVGALLGMQMGDSEPVVARPLCQGSDDRSTSLARYEGILSCSAASLLFPGGKSCQFGCMGLGDCVRACKFAAIHVENGVVHVDDLLCTGCGMCVQVCPKGILKMMPRSQRVWVACRNVSPGAIARKACLVACIGCRRCEKVCQDDAVHVASFLATIDAEKCTACGRCAPECPMGSIVDLCRQERAEVEAAGQEKQVS